MSMFNKSMLSLVIILIKCQHVWAAQFIQDSSHAIEMSPIHSLTAPQVISKPIWIKYQTSDLPKKLCQEKSLIRECFNLEPKVCDEFATSITQACLSALENRITHSMTELDRKENLTLLKACSYDLFEKLMANQVSAHPECQNLSNRLIKQDNKANTNQLTLDKLPPSYKNLQSLMQSMPEQKK